MNEYKIVDIPAIVDERGSLSFVELGGLLDFEIKRAYWLYDTKKERGAHAHKKLKQFIFCSSGSLEFILDNGINRETVKLDMPNKGLIIQGPLWREVGNFKNNPCVVILASDIYNESDYIRSYQEFIKWKSNF